MAWTMSPGLTEAMVLPFMIVWSEMQRSVMLGDTMTAPVFPGKEIVVVDLALISAIVATVHLLSIGFVLPGYYHILEKNYSSPRLILALNSSTKLLK